jgi:pyruvate carboxylase
MADHHDPNAAYSEVFEDVDVKEPHTVHRIRANSSIMQLKKLLGEFFLLPAPLGMDPSG